MNRQYGERCKAQDLTDFDKKDNVETGLHTQQKLISKGTKTTQFEYFIVTKLF